METGDAAVSEGVDAREAYEAAMGSRIENESIELGPWASDDLRNDPRHLAFVLGRYKFCAKMLAGKQRVLEVGCGDAFGLPLVAQSVGHVHAVDWDQRQLDGNGERLSHLSNVSYGLHDFNEGPLSMTFDAIYWVDVIEHIEPAREKAFLDNLMACLEPGGVMVTGTPNVTAADYASEASKIHHINLKGFEELRETMRERFENVFMFGMNDEVLHTGFGPMSHYVWSVAAGPRSSVS